MKKITIALIALVLICSSVYASISVTAGTGFGLNFATNSKKITKIKSSVENVLPFVAGFDYETPYGFSVYADSSLGFVVGRNYDTKATKTLVKDTVKLSVFEMVEQAGVGYTFHFGQFSVMGGAGLDMRYMSSSAATGYKYSDKLLAFGLGARVKGVYEFNENWGISAQINPALDFLFVKSDIQPKDVNLFSATAYVGGVYKF